MAGTAQADGIGLPVMTIHPAASTSYPKELVNGDFQTFGNRIVDKRSGSRQYLSFVDGNGMAMEGSSEQPWAKVDGWDAVKFGWKSNDSVSGHRGIVEVQRFRTAVKGSTGNVWGEIAAATQGKYLYQDIDTANTSDAMYTVRLKHASRNKDARDSMQVLVGAPGREKPVTMRRTIANAGDKAGEESTTITSTGTGQDDQWDTYEGTVLVPRGQDVTRFTFKSVADSNSAGRPDSAEGNLIDDVVFTKAYQLTYDANGGVKTRTSQIDYTTGGETRGKVKTVRDSPAPPAGQEKIVNGDFEYSGTGAGLSDSPFNYVSLSRKSYYYKDSRNVNHRVALPAGFDAKRFAWKSDQTGKDLGNPPYEQAGDVQVWNRYDGSNHYAELTAAQAGSAIYQDIDTESDSDVQYIVSLRHASLNASHLDSMQVLIGAPGHETPVTMTRVTANGYGDKVGESSDTIATRVSNPKPADREDSDHTGQWETYTGTVTVPAGRPVTRFTFRNVSSKSAWNGNLIDDIAFTKARRLDYDANGGTKAQASQIGYRTDATQGAVETVASKALPTELVNGSFDYLLDGGWDTISPVGRGGYADDRGWGRFTSVDPASGEYIQNAGQNPATFDSTGKWVKWPGFDAAKFGWASDQKGGQPQGGVGLTDRPNAVELQQDSVTGNTYAEIVGSERGKAILQKIDTQHDSDTVYTVRFDHASLSKEHADSMQVLVNGKPVTMTRVTSNKAGDEQGWTGTSITTHATNTNRFQHDGQWATYEGKVTIPANTPVSTFTFKSLNEAKPDMGNLIDNLTFKIAYRLSYDSNGGTKAKASQISSMTEGKASETDGKVKTVTDDAAGSIPSNENAGAVKQAKSKTNGSVRLAADDDVAEYAANGLPDHLVNGDFEYPSMKSLQHYFTGIDRNRSQWISNGQGDDLAKWSDIPGGLDTTRFGWSSTQTQGAMSEQRANAVELQKATGETTQMGELCASQKDTAIYQDIATTPGTLYRIELDHTSRYRIHLDQMQVMVGAPGHEQPVEMTRTSSNKYGDKIGEKSTTIATHSTNPFGNQSSKDDFSHYVGYYTIPAGQSVTRFTFRQVSGVNTTSGNLLDNIVFTKAYKLDYDKNSDEATGQTPNDTATVKPAKTSATGGVKNVADTNASLPDHLVNGDFEYLPDGGWKTVDAPSYMTNAYTSVDPNNGQYMRNAKHSDADLASWADWPGFDQSKFAWKTDQKGGHDQGGLKDRAEAVELQQDSADGNTYAEMVASETGRTIYQNLATIPGTLYKIRLKHASLCKDNVDQMQVVINGTPIEMTRVAANGKAGDKVGEKSKTIGTRVTNGNRWHHYDQWETYEGYYVIPDGQTTTRFGFKAVNYLDPTKGNLLDDVTFARAYKLSYDANGGAKKSTSQIKASTDGKVKTIAGKTDSLPTELVNGSFDYPAGLIAGVSTKYPWDDWTVVDPINGRYARHIGIDKDPWAPIPGWDASKFAWKSTQTKGTDWQQIAQGVELQKDSKTGNQYAELVAGQAGTAIYQDIATIPGVSYRWTLKHASLDRNHLDGMSVMIGEPGKESAQDARRTTVNGNGDQPGDVGKVISTKVSNDAESNHESNHSSRNHDGQWETYTGTYIATGTVTRFTFKSVSSSNNVNGNILDDLSFTKAYKLGYDGNGGAKTSTSRISAASNGKVRFAATRANVPSRDLEDTDVPGQYRDFILDTTKVKFSDVKFENGAWLNAPMPDSGDGATAMFPLKIGASATLPNVGEWTDGSGHTHSINAIISLHSWNGGSISRLWTRLDGQPFTSRDLFWINTVGRNSDLPAQVIKALGGIDTSKRVGCQWTVNFTYEDGTPVPDTFRGVTGFNDLDGWDVQPDLKFEGVQLVSGFDGAYKTRDAELATYGINGFAGVKHDSGPESNLDGKQQFKHRLAATWTGSSFTFGYDLQNPEGRDRGCRMTFGVPVTRTKVLTYDANGGKGSVPSHTEAGKVEAASAKTAGSVHAISDATDTTGSAEGKAVLGVLTDTTARQDDGTSQRTITRSDGSVRVETIATTGAVSGCQVYYPAGTRITLATAKADSDCWDSSQIGKTNRTFYGWSANTDSNDRDVPVGDTMDRNTLNANARTEIVMPARAKTVYALWAINPTLSYNVNTPAGSNAPGTPASQTVPYNTAAADKSGWAAGDTGKIPGYRFDGWYTAPNGGNKYDFNTPLTNNVTVYAHWIGNGYTVRFTGNGATGGGTPDQAFQYNIGQNLHRNGFVRDGYTFTGWKRADNQQAYGDGQWVTNLTTQPNGIVTMVAQWSANEAHIRYNPNPPAGKTTGGQGTPNWDGHTGDTPTIGQNGWTIDGYTFAGWATSPDGSGARYAPGARWTANGTLTLYAQWTPGQAGLTYDGNGATGGKTDPQTGKTDEKINVRDNGFTRDGYTFVTWNTQADCKGNAVKPNSEWTLRGSSTLYACWAGNAQTLTYHGNGATGGNTAAQSGKTGDELTTNANGFTRDGYTFVRWDTAKDGSGTAYGEGKNGVSQYVMKPAGNDLYAIWKANPATIQYRNDWPNTTGSTPDTTGSTGDTVTVSQNGFDRPGYTFTGWSTSKRGDPSLNPGDKHTLEPGTTTVWAQWKANPAHLVYNSNIGSIGSETKTVDGVVDQTVKTIDNPFDRPGYTFSGWNTQADGKGKAYDPGADCTLTANDKSTPKNTSVLYAQWTINKVTLKFDPNGGVGGYPSINTDAFGSVAIPKDAKEPKVTRPGFRFTGWSLKKTPDKDETLLTPGKDTVSMPAEGEVTVYAQWEPAMTTLPFTGGNAQIPTIWLWAGLAFLIIAAGAFSPMIRLRMGAGSKGRHAGTPTIGRHSR